MISLPISLKRKKKRSRCHYGSGRNPRLVRPRRYKAEQMSRSVKNEEKRRLTAAPLSCLFSSSDNVYRKCLANGTWALKGNYSMCKAILHEEVRPSYECMSWLTRRFHTEPSKHETYINQKKKKTYNKRRGWQRRAAGDSGIIYSKYGSRAGSEARGRDGSLQLDEC